MKRILACLLCLALCLALAACQDQEEPSPSQEESSASAAPTQEPAPTPSPTPFVPAADLIPAETAEPGTFAYAFSQNPIDKLYDAEYALATSARMMQAACENAAANWQQMVEDSYAAALSAVSASQTASLREEQAAWLQSAEAREITAAANLDPDDDEAILSAAKERVLLYRGRAKELCQLVYDATGSLPDFPDVGTPPVA